METSPSTQTDSGVVTLNDSSVIELLPNFKISFGALKSIYAEHCKLVDLATKLDSMNPTLPGAFFGSAHQRITNQLKAKGIIS